ncbi:hypothetical protein L7F22_047995 [Adiantum nelumboides]|nr:hypothetical protein [Adiantum nelumboides]
MKKDTLDYVRRCLICQKTKAERVKIPGKLQPLDIPQMKWECISMDFVTGLPKTTGNYDSIFVIVDKLTKVAHLIPVKQTDTAADIAQVFVKEIVRLHGIPARIISDRDAKFTSKFWQAMFQSLGTQLNLSTAYHPETDGQTERVNQVIEDMLRAYCNQQPQKWIKFLHLVEFAYNSSHHRSLGMSPFKALYGQECLVPLRLADPTLHVPAAKSTLEMMDQQLLIIRDNLKRASDRQKSYADLHRSARSFSKGEWVVLDIGLVVYVIDDLPAIFMFSLGSAAITWSSKKQPTVALSSTEAEYRGAAVAACEVAWLELLLGDLGIQVQRPVVIHCDNLSSIQLA